MSRTSSLLLLVLCAWGGLAPCLAQPSLQPLVKLHDTRVNAAGPALVSSTDDDVLITVGGDLVSTAVTRKLIPPGSHFQTTIAQGTASPAALSALNEALAAGHPAQLSGVCGADIVPLGSTFRYQITWFGSHNLSSTFTLTNEGDGTNRCSAGEVAIATAILSLEDEVLADPATHFTRSSCDSDADCAAGQLCCYPCGFPGCSNVCTPIPSGQRCPLIP